MSVNNFLMREKLKLLSQEKSPPNKGLLLSAYVPFCAALDVVELMRSFQDRNLSRADKSEVQRALKEKLSTYKPGKQGTIVFLGITSGGTVAEVITPSQYSGGSYATVGHEFDKKLLKSLATNPPATPVIMVDRAGTETFILQNDSIKSFKRVAFHAQLEPKKHQLDVFRTELASVKKMSRSSTLVLGLHKDMKWIKDEASEVLKEFQAVISSRIMEVNQMNLDSIITTLFSELSSFDIVLQMKTLRDFSSTLDHFTTTGLLESLDALQHHRLKVLLILSTARLDLFVPRDDAHGLATTTNERGEHLLKRIDIYQWLEENEERLGYKAVVITLDLPQSQQLERVGGVAGILK